MTITHDYEVNVTWNEARKGTMSGPGLGEQIEVVTPPEFPAGIPGVWSPEHLFTAAVNSCLMTTFLAIAENSKLHFNHFSSKALGRLEMIEGKYVMSEITLMPLVTIDNEEDREKADRILHKSEAACLISNSIKSKIIFKPTIEVLAPAA